jgi:hypothetical protein
MDVRELEGSEKSEKGEKCGWRAGCMVCSEDGL